MKRSEIIFMLLQVPLDYLMLLFAGITAYLLRFSAWAQAAKPVVFHLTFGSFFHVTLYAAVVWIIFFAFSGLYIPDPNRKLTHDLSRIVLACTAGLAGIALFILFSQTAFDSRFLIVAGWITSIIFVSVGRISMRGVKAILYRAGLGLRRVVIVGGNEIATTLLQTLQARPELGYRVLGEQVHFNESNIAALKKMKLDEIMYTNSRADETEALALLDFCNEAHIGFKYSADLFATYSTNMAVHPLAGIPIVSLRRTALDGWGRVVKRIADILISLVSIIIFSPIMLIAALLILCETGSPIIYKNERVGLRGRKFLTYKFRTMYQKDSTGSQFGHNGKRAEAREKTLIKKQSIKNGPIYKIANDPRVTQIGRFLRRTSIDEMPQFFNVLGGSMSVVGPRPHQPREVAGYAKSHRTVLSVKPGITGLAQISGRSDLSYEDEARLDVLYIERWHLTLDLIIVLKTPFILFKKRRAL